MGFLVKPVPFLSKRIGRNRYTQRETFGNLSTSFLTHAKTTTYLVITVHEICLKLALYKFERCKTT